MTQTPTPGAFLLRFWGRDAPLLAERHGLISNEGDEVFAVWFDSEEAREAFVSANPYRSAVCLDRVEPSAYSHLLTIATVTLEAEGRSYTYRHGFGFGFPDGSVEYMYRDGSYSCDANRASFIRAYSDGKDFQERDCGEEIELVSLVVTHEAAPTRQKETK